MNSGVCRLVIQTNWVEVHGCVDSFFSDVRCKLEVLMKVRRNKNFSVIVNTKSEKRVFFS